jgi:hypothetical protein
MLIDWLNTTDNEYQRAVVEEFINATNAPKPSLDRAKKAYDKIIGGTPARAPADLRVGRIVNWELVPQIHHRQIKWIERTTKEAGLAELYDSLIELAILDLLPRVRQCTLQSCRRWFFARFKHARFHAVKCQQQAIRSDPEWKKQHAAQMRNARRRERIREQKTE